MQATCTSRGGHTEWVLEEDKEAFEAEGIALLKWRPGGGEPEPREEEDAMRLRA